MASNLVQLTRYLEQNPWVQWALLGVALWSLCWKGMALWRAAHRHERWWFVALLIVNTVGILEILYLFVFSKRRESAAQPYQ